MYFWMQNRSPKLRGRGLSIAVGQRYASLHTTYPQYLSNDVFVSWKGADDDDEEACSTEIASPTSSGVTTLRLPPCPLRAEFRMREPSAVNVMLLTVMEPLSFGNVAFVPSISLCFHYRFCNRNRCHKNWPILTAKAQFSFLAQLLQKRGMSLICRPMNTSCHYWMEARPMKEKERSSQWNLAPH